MLSIICYALKNSRLCSVHYYYVLTELALIVNEKAQSIREESRSRTRFDEKKTAVACCTAAESSWQEAVGRPRTRLLRHKY